MQYLTASATLILLLCTSNAFGQPSKLCTVDVTEPNTFTVTVHDSVHGVQSIGVNVGNNITVTIPPFPAGTLDPVAITATSTDPLQSAGLELSVCTHTCTTCDSVGNLIIREAGRPLVHWFVDLPPEYHFITIVNSTPGLRNLLIEVNGIQFRVTGLDDGEEIVLDVSSAMIPGRNNMFALHPRGRIGASALVLIHD